MLWVRIPHWILSEVKSAGPADPLLAGWGLTTLSFEYSVFGVG